MIKPTNDKLFEKCVKASTKKFGEEQSWKAVQWLVARYIAKGGLYTFSTDAEIMEIEKQAAINAIEKALVDTGFTKVDDNAFAIGNASLPTKTIANLLQVSHQPWYQLLINQAISLKTKSGVFTINKGDFFSIASWSGETALLDTPKLGAAAVTIPIQVAYALLHASRPLSKREKKFR